MGFSTFLIGYSLPPFMEVGFGVGSKVETGGAPPADLMKQYEELYKNADE